MSINLGANFLISSAKHCTSNMYSDESPKSPAICQIEVL
jgi:hypothetical protein